MTTTKTSGLTHHYFATTAFAFGTGATLAEAMEKAARLSGADAIKSQLKMSGGLYCWTCKVMAPPEADYHIENFKPKGVPIEDGREFNLVNTKGHCLPIERKT